MVQVSFLLLFFAARRSFAQNFTLRPNANGDRLELVSGSSDAGNVSFSARQLPSFPVEIPAGKLGVLSGLPIPTMWPASVPTSPELLPETTTSSTAQSIPPGVQGPLGQATKIPTPLRNGQSDLLQSESSNTLTARLIAYPESLPPLHIPVLDPFSGMFERSLLHQRPVQKDSLRPRLPFVANQKNPHRPLGSKQAFVAALGQLPFGSASSSFHTSLKWPSAAPSSEFQSGVVPLQSEQSPHPKQLSGPSALPNQMTGPVPGAGQLPNQNGQIAYDGCQ